MNMQTDSAQAPYDPGKPGIRWNPRPMDPRMVVAAILVAGLAIGGGIAWSGYMQAQAVRCASIPASAELAWLASGKMAVPDEADTLRGIIAARGCDDSRLAPQ